jgi:MinD superfamily P-loop ATPase
VIITVASGKGGTGKTTIATSLAMVTNAVTFLDCDVEAPNAHLFLYPNIEQRQDVDLLVPVVNEGRCTGCGRCAEICQYHAIVVLAGNVLVFPELCHGCGSCTLNCPENAISEKPKTLGILKRGRAVTGIGFAQGVLNVGQPMAVPVIRQLKRWGPFPSSHLIIKDAPPGTSCPVVETIRGSEFVILVTEPTPFGMHDLKLAVQVVRELNIPAGVVINRDGIGNSDVDDYCWSLGLPILMRIPMDRRIAEALASGTVLTMAFPEYISDFRKMYTNILSLVGVETMTSELSQSSQE